MSGEVKLKKVAHDPNEYAAIKDASTGEVLHMMLGEEDYEDVVGRMPVGGNGDLSEFDLMPPLESEMGPEYETYDSIFGEQFSAPSPMETHFPRYTAALRRFQAKEPTSRAMRVDTDETFGAFVAEQAVQELERRLNELRQAVEDHASDRHGGRMHQIRKWDEIVGAAQLVEDIRCAGDADEAASALPQVPLDLPPFAVGKVRCWRDGNKIVCSIRFGAPDGSPRIATMAAQPLANEAEVAGCAMRAGVDPAVVLGALPELVDRACAKRLVRDVAGAALKAQRRLDVMGMTEPVVLVGASGATAPVAALMDLQQQADGGDAQAQHEVAALDAAASSPMGRKSALPVLSEARARLAKGRQAKTGYLAKYLNMGRYL